MNETPVLIVDALLLVNDILIKPDLGFYGLRRGYPVDRSLYLSSVRAVASSGSRIIGAVHHRHISRVVLLVTESFQFVRQGFFCVDCKDSKPEKLVFNRIVSLKSSY